MMLNNNDDYSLLTMSDQNYNNTYKLSNKLLDDIKIAISSENIKSLHTVIKVNLVKNGKTSSSADKTAIKTIKHVAKILTKNNKSKELSTKARKKAKQIVKDNKITLKQEGKSSKSASAIAKKI